MTPDYSARYYQSVSMNRKRRIIDQQLDELHSIQLDMIDEAVKQSDLSQAREIINYIRSL
jgi:hypothetical protein